MIKQQGQYIVVEGLEGAGKSSTISTLTAALKKHNINYLLVREPGGTPVGETLRDIIKGQEAHEPLTAETELLLMYAARKQLMDRVIIPAIREGTWVVSDRNEWSSIAYQGYGRGLDLTLIHTLSNHLIPDLIPDLILYLDINPELGLKRANNRGAYDRIEREPMAFFRRVHQGYRELVSSNEQVRVIPASLPFDQVQENVLQCFEQFICEKTNSND